MKRVAGINLAYSSTYGTKKIVGTDCKKNSR
jgi:hypothetical protein